MKTSTVIYGGIIILAINILAASMLSFNPSSCIMKKFKSTDYSSSTVGESSRDIISTTARCTPVPKIIEKSHLPVGSNSMPRVMSIV